MLKSFGSRLLRRFACVDRLPDAEPQPDRDGGKQSAGSIAFLAIENDVVDLWPSVKRKQFYTRFEGLAHPVITHCVENKPLNDWSVKCIQFL